MKVMEYKCSFLKMCSLNDTYLYWHQLTHKFQSTPLHYIPFHFIWFHSTPLHYIPFHSIPLHSIIFNSILFHTIPHYYILFYSEQDGVVIGYLLHLMTWINSDVNINLDLMHFTGCCPHFWALWFMLGFIHMFKPCQILLTTFVCTSNQCL